MGLNGEEDMQGGVQVSKELANIMHGRRHGLKRATIGCRRKTKGWGTLWGRERMGELGCKHTAECLSAQKRGQISDKVNSHSPPDHT